jgi:hypothetical protein
MIYFKVSLPGDSLPWYAMADNAVTAIRRVEAHAGPADLNGRTRYQAAAVDAIAIPKWMEVLGEPADLAAERQAEEEF